MHSCGGAFRLFIRLYLCYNKNQPHCERRRIAHEASERTHPARRRGTPRQRIEGRQLPEPSDGHRPDGGNRPRIQAPLCPSPCVEGYKVRYIGKEESLLEKVTISNFYLCFGIKDGKLLLINDDGTIFPCDVIQKGKVAFEVLEDDDDCTLSKQIKEMEK